MEELPVAQRTARNWYRWLWLSPLVTLPVLVWVWEGIEPGYDLICGDSYRGCDRGKADKIDLLAGVLASSLAHLVLLIPALDRKRAFVRWHGRQMLLLAALRTVIPLAFALAFGESSAALLSVPALIVIWLLGTLVGQIQAKDGNCSLARWAGRADVLPVPKPTRTTKPVRTPIRTTKPPPSPVEVPPASDPEALVDVIRFSQDPRARLLALYELRKLGLVEPL